MPSNCRKLELATLLLVLLPGVARAAPAAAVSGVVRSAEGAVQMGAMVQVFAPGSVSVATVFTDLNGRYRITNLLPGRYDIRASAPLFAPAIRGNLRLPTGARATVNLTLALLSDAASLIPAQPRRPDEPEDDWTWTLRSAANRSVLRLLDDGQVVLVTPAAAEASSASSSTQAHVSVSSGSGGFAGDGLHGGPGVHNVVALDRAANRSDLVLRADIPAAVREGQSGPVELDAAIERSTLFGASSRLVVSYQSSPGIVTAGEVGGMRVMRLAGAQRLMLGEAINVEAGSTVYAVRMGGSAVQSQPFVRVTIHPGQVWAVRYSLATARDLQGFDGLDSIRASTPATAEVNGRLRSASGLHQEIAVSRKLGAGVIQAAVYHDQISRSAIAGTGAIGAGDMLPGCGASAVVADASGEAFQFLGLGYAAHGVSVVLEEPVAADLWATAEYRTGAALASLDAAAHDSAPATLAQMSAGLHPQLAGSATASLRARLPRTGTKLWAAYRWQPHLLLTPVAAYDGASDQGYLSFFVRQALRWGDRLPPGLEARIDVTNLLAEGYQPFLSADGKTLFLAQSPRTLQAGLAFTF